MSDRYRQLEELDVPLVMLIGGATGTGKSTVATEIAYRLRITRLTSTDSIRQTMRAFFSREFMPTVHYSSFGAGAALPDADDPLVAGFLGCTILSFGLAPFLGQNFFPVTLIPTGCVIAAIGLLPSGHWIYRRVTTKRRHKRSGES